MKLSERTRKWLAAIIAVLFLVVAVLPLANMLVSAAPSNAEKKQNIKDDIREIDQKEDEVTQKKKQLDTDIETLNEEVRDIESKIRQDDIKLAVLEDELAVALKAEQKQYETFKKRLRIMYEQGSKSYLEVLLSSESLSDFLNRFELMKQVSAYDKQIAETLTHTRTTIEQTKQQAEEIKQQKVEQSQALQQKKKSLNAKVQESEKLLNDLKKDKAKLEAQLKKIEQEEAAARAAAAQAARSSSSANVKYNGSMLWPAPGHYNISSYYGNRIHPVLGYAKLHTGIDISAPYGAKAVAADSGTVVTATYNGAYGNYVVVDHGGGIMTLYAHGSKLTVSKGQKVSRGQQVLAVGSTGYSTGPHLHFEVITNGSTTNPMNYLK